MKTPTALALALFLCCSNAVSADPIVSNLGERDYSHWGITYNFWSATRFTTDATAYTLDNVVMRVSNSSPRSDNGIFVSIYNDNAVSPGSLVGSTLTPATNITSTLANVAFTPSGVPANLSASTDYWVVVGQNDLTSDANPVYRKTGSSWTGPGTLYPDIWTWLSQDQRASWSLFPFGFGSTPERSCCK